MVFGNGELKAILTGRHEDKAILKLIYDGNLDNVLNRIGQMPLPPYIRRKANEDNGLSGQDKKNTRRFLPVFPAQ
jgi:S-adenosylmethionine:tRNA ribosyltransferase-isomerase